MLTTGLKGSKSGKALRKIRRLTRALGTVRELDVTLGVLDELARADGVPRSAVEAVRARVVAERDHGREVMLKRFDRVNVDKLHRRLGSVADALEKSTGQEWRETLAARLVKRAQRLTAAMDEAGQMYSPERLHQVRIAVKKLRYAVELAVEAGGEKTSADLRTLKRAQDLLGRLHDRQVLVDRVRQIQAAASADLRAERELEAIVDTLENECRRLHARYVRDRASLADICARSVARPQSAGPARRATSRRLAS